MLQRGVFGYTAFFVGTCQFCFKLSWGYKQWSEMCRKIWGRLQSISVPTPVGRVSLWQLSHASPRYQPLLAKTPWPISGSHIYNDSAVTRTWSLNSFPPTIAHTVMGEVELPGAEPWMWSYECNYTSMNSGWPPRYFFSPSGQQKLENYQHFTGESLLPCLINHVTVESWQ